MLDRLRHAPSGLKRWTVGVVVAGGRRPTTSRSVCGVIVKHEMGEVLIDNLMSTVCIGIHFSFLGSFESRKGCEFGCVVTIDGHRVS